MKQFNINSTVKVRLTQYGKELHKKQKDELVRPYTCIELPTYINSK